MSSSSVAACVHFINLAMNMDPLEPLALLCKPSTKDHAIVTYKLPVNLSRSDQDFIGSLRQNSMLNLVHDARLNVSAINGRLLVSQTSASPVVECIELGNDANSSRSNDSDEYSSSESSSSSETGPTFTMLLVSSDGSKFSESIDLDTPETRQFAEDCFKRLYEKRMVEVRRTLI